jgi:hypothetical protein
MDSGKSKPKNSQLQFEAVGQFNLSVKEAAEKTLALLPKNNKAGPNHGFIGQYLF